MDGTALAGLYEGYRSLAQAQQRQLHQWIQSQIPVSTDRAFDAAQQLHVLDDQAVPRRLEARQGHVGDRFNRARERHQPLQHLVDDVQHDGVRPERAASRIDQPRCH